MKLTPTTARLDRSRSLRISGAQRVTARCGTLWVTRDGEPDDLVLEAGMSVALDGRTPALVTALGGAAVVSATPLARPLPAVPWWQALRRWTTPEPGTPA